MASSVSGQDDPNRARGLATRAGKMEPSCLLRTTRCIPQAKFPWKPYNKSFIDQVCSGRDGWILASFFFCEFMDLDFVSVHKHAKKELGQYPAMLTSHLVNNPYIITKWQLYMYTRETGGFVSPLELKMTWVSCPSLSQLYPLLANKLYYKLSAPKFICTKQ